VPPVPVQPKQEFYVCRVEKRGLVPEGVEVAWLPLGRTVTASDANAAMSSVRNEMGPGVLVAVPVSQVTVAAALQSIEMSNAPTNNVISA
jgi:hypothetical protein